MSGQIGTGSLPLPCRRAFLEAIQNVQAIGLSFGGLCFFETGVTAEYPGTPPPYEMFSSKFSETPS